jgi:hypothetical protein
MELFYFARFFSVRLGAGTTASRRGWWFAETLEDTSPTPAGCRISHRPVDPARLNRLARRPNLHRRQSRLPTARPEKKVKKRSRIKRNPVGKL